MRLAHGLRTTTILTRKAGLPPSLSAPAIVSGPTTASLTEGTGAGQTIGNYISTGYLPPTWSLTGADAASFSINSSGVLTLTPNPDYETKTSYSVTVNSTNASGTATRSLTLTITNSTADDPPATYPATTTGIVMDGDSIAYGIGQNFSSVAPGFPITTVAKSGYKTGELVDLFEEANTTNQDRVSNPGPGVASFFNSSTTNTLVLHGGTNDFYNDIRTVDQVTANYQAYAAKAHAAGYRFAICTILPTNGWQLEGEVPRATEDMDGRRDAVNTWLRANWSSFAEVLVDYDEVPELQNWSATYFGDAVHLNTAGNTLAMRKVCSEVAPLAPDFTVNPVLSGDPSVGQTLTLSTGTATGRPAVTYARSFTMDGSVVGTGASYVVQAGDAGKVPGGSVVATNEVGTDTAASNTLAAVTAAASQAMVNSNGTAWLYHSNAQVAASSKFLFSAWITPNAANVSGYIWGNNANYISMTGTGNRFGITINDTAGTLVYNAARENVFSNGVKVHIAVVIDLTVPVGTLYVNGVAVAPTHGSQTTAIAGNGLLALNQWVGVGAQTEYGSLPANVKYGDFFMQAGGTLPSVSTLYNNGNPPDLTGVGTPYIWLGGNMRANASATGNTAQGWNDGYNKGSATLVVGSGTYTDVP